VPLVDPEPLDPEPLLPEPELLPLLEAVVEELAPEDPDPQAQSINTTEVSTQMVINLLFIVINFSIEKTVNMPIQKFRIAPELPI
jgi:hypothetical protein